MRLRVRSTALSGMPLDTETEDFCGETCLDLVAAMQAGRRFAVLGSLDAFIDDLVAGVRRFAGIHLVVKGETASERASALIGALLDAKLATIDDEPPASGKGAHP
jgi:hypothetical protein